MEIRRKKPKPSPAGQLAAPPPEAPAPALPSAPTETKDILKRYQLLAGKAVHHFEMLEKLQSRDINAIAALGKVVAILPALESMAGSDDLNNLTREELKAELAARGLTQQLPAGATDAVFEEVESDDETE